MLTTLTGGANATLPERVTQGGRNRAEMGGLRAVVDTALDGWLPAAVYYAAYLAARLRKAAHLGWRAGAAAQTEEAPR